MGEGSQTVCMGIVSEYCPKSIKIINNHLNHLKITTNDGNIYKGKPTGPASAER